MQQDKNLPRKRSGQLISTRQEIQHLAELLKKHQKIAVDTEFIRETTYYPKIGLIQVATLEESYLVDPLALSKEDLSPLFDVFTDKNILKIFHAAQSDQECLWTSYGVLATPCLDTAQAAMLCGFGENVGLAKLLKEVLRVEVQKGHARTDWTRRPLHDSLLQYAYADVDHLVELANALLSLLEKQGRRDWAFSLCTKFEDPKTYQPDSLVVAKKHGRSGKLDPRGVALLAKLWAWRELRCQKLDIPKRRLVDDDVLIALSMVRPKTLEHLSQFRGLSKGEVKNSGEQILEMVLQVEALSKEALPVIDKAQIPSAAENRVLELFNVFVRTIADDLGLVPRLLLSGDELLSILRSKETDVQKLVQQGLLSSSSASMVGVHLEAFLKGKKCLQVKEGRVVVADFL